MTQPNTETKSPAVPPIRVRRIVWSVVCACIVFAGFVAYAFLAPTTYQTTTEVRLQIPAGLENSLHPIADRRHRLTKAVLGPDSLKQLSNELGVTTPDERLELANQLSSGVSIATSDGQVFRIVCTNAAALRAQQLCQGLARMAAAQLPEAAVRRDGPEDQERKEQLERLLDFLSQHPELSSAQGQDTQGAGHEKDVTKGQAPAAPAHADALLNTLTQQRRVVISELNELQRVDPKNPYADGLKQEVDQAHKRLAAIDAALATRRKGLEGATKENAGPELDSKVMSRLTEQLNQLALRNPKPASTAGLKATVSQEASLPSSPILPDRTRLLILGALASLGVAILGLGFAFAARERPEPNRPTSAYPNGAGGPSLTGSMPPVAPGMPLVISPAPAAPDYGVVPPGPAAHYQPEYAAAPDYQVAAQAEVLPGYPVPPQAVPARPSDFPHGATAVQVAPNAPPLEPQPQVNLTTTQVMEEPAPPQRAEPAQRPDAQRPEPQRPEPQRIPRTQLGGFDLTAPTPPEEPTAPDPLRPEVVPQGRRPQEKPSRTDNPISVKAMVALEANVNGEEPEEAAPQTLLGGMHAEHEHDARAPQVDARAPQARAPQADARAPQARGYTPPKRNITRRLGSLSWLDQAELTRQAPPQPVSTRYSYVSSRPPPPDGAHETSFQAQVPEVIDVPAEPDQSSMALSLPRPAAPITRRHPVPAGWNLPADVMQFSTPELAATVSEGWRSGCIIVGVTARFDLSRIKASVAASLAFRLGEFVPRVLLMEADFQDPKVHRILRVEMPIAGGLSQQLQLRLARGSAPDFVWEVMECHPTVDVLAEGFIRSPGGILSQQFEECVNDLRTCYDLIIVDGPPVSTGSEPQAFADLVDGVVVCTPRDRPDVQGLADSLFRNQRFIVPFPLRI